MKTVGVVVSGLFAILLVLAIVVVIAFISFNNTAVRSENGIVAQYEQNKNNYDNFFKQLKEAAQVPDMYVQDLRKVWDDAMRGRYGADGSKAVFQWIQEQNPQVSPELYLKLQTIIVAGRNRFEADQKMLIDKQREYANFRGTFPNSVFASVLGFPKIDLLKYGIVTSDETEGIFESKKGNPIKIRP